MYHDIANKPPHCTRKLPLLQRNYESQPTCLIVKACNLVLVEINHVVRFQENNLNVLNFFKMKEILK